MMSMSEKFETEVATITYIANTDIDYGNSYKDADVLIILPSEKFSKKYDTDKLTFKLADITTNIENYEYDFELDDEENLGEWQSLVMGELDKYLLSNTRNMETSDLSDNICWKIFEYHSEELIGKMINKGRE